MQRKPLLTLGNKVVGFSQPRKSFWLQAELPSWQPAGGVALSEECTTLAQLEQHAQHLKEDIDLVLEEARTKFASPPE